jgi:hypothetical protein
MDASPRQQGTEMSTATITPSTAARIEPPYVPAATSEPGWVRIALIAIAVGFAILFLLIPLAVVFTESFKKGWDAYLAAITEEDAWLAIKLTLLTAAIAVPANLIFGLSASWAIAKFEVRGKNLLLTLIDRHGHLPGKRFALSFQGMRTAGLTVLSRPRFLSARRTLESAGLLRLAEKHRAGARAQTFVLTRLRCADYDDRVTELRTWTESRGV